MARKAEAPALSGVNVRCRQLWRAHCDPDTLPSACISCLQRAISFLLIRCRHANSTNITDDVHAVASQTGSLLLLLFLLLNICRASHNANLTSASTTARQDVHKGGLANVTSILFAAKQDVHRGGLAKLTWVSFAARQDAHKGGFANVAWVFFAARQDVHER